ncbi:MAG: formate--tetrahydrofolate ligase [Candidatus Kariarchaeaceae archaeon]|jgi:formate--tetrahydrofolate ligase
MIVNSLVDTFCEDRFIYPITGKMLTMPALPPIPVAENIDIDEDGKITGLF